MEREEIIKYIKKHDPFYIVVNFKDYTIEQLKIIKVRIEIELEKNKVKIKQQVA